MKKLLKKPVLTASLACALFTATQAFAATDAADMPVILTLKTNIYGYQGPDNSFTIYLGSLTKDTEFFVTTGKTSEYVWVNPWTLGKDDDDSNAAIATAVTLSVTEANNTVEIRGDASQLDYIDVHGCYLSSIEFNGDYPNLTVLDLSHNELPRIDVEKLTSLQSLDITDNAITVGENMKIGANHPDLYILQVGINDDVDPNLDLKNYPNLAYFSGRNNYGITHIDPTGCPELVSLVLEITNITEIDVSKNTKLDVLNLSQTRVTDIDISKNVNLGEFYANHEGSYNSTDPYKLTSIDLSNNPKLQYLDLGGNKLTHIDLSNNPDLILIFLQKNQLSEIDLSACTKLAKLDLSNNQFTFATLPIPQQGWDYYYNRGPLDCNFKYKVGETIDLSSSVIRAPYTDAQGNTITPVTDARVFTVPRAGEVDMLDPESGIYTYADGKITFNQALADSVYVKFSNSVFYDWDIDTRNFMVKTEEDYDLPSAAFSFTPAASIASQSVTFNMGVKVITSGVSTPCVITLMSAGEKIAELDADLTAFNAVSFTVPAQAEAIDVMLTDGYSVSALEMSGIALASVDLSPAEYLTDLTITGAGLAEIDLGYNRILRTIDLSDNALTFFDLTAVRGDYEKYYTTDINLSNNKLTSISAVNYKLILNLNLANNEFREFNAQYYTGLQQFDISNNKLTGELDLSKQESLQSLNVSGNDINKLTIGSLQNIRNLDVRGNRLSFATLPVVSGSGIIYNYAPQQKFSIIEGGAAINLSDQNIQVDGASTAFVWKYADTDMDVEPGLYSINNGAAQFGQGLIGKTLYCEMTHTAFPDFDSRPLTTTNITVLDKPTNLVASFTTVNSGEAQVGFRFATSGANAVYIDWSGEGLQYDEYIYDDANTSIYRTGQAYAGKTAKVYTYGDPSNVNMFFTFNVKLKDCDLSPMTKLEAVGIHSAGLNDGSLILPDGAPLWEIILDGNNFETEDFSQYTKVSSLGLGSNSYRTFDLSKYPNVVFVQLASNRLESIKFGNNDMLYQLDVTNNKLSDIDLNGLSNLSELIIPDNLFTEIDLSPVQKQLRALSVSGNYLTFETLPRIEDFNTQIFTTYYYANQQPLPVECVNGTIDLSAQAYVGDTPTEFLWFLGDRQTDVYYDYYYEMFMGEQLESPEINPDDPEYVVENGVTTFRYKPTRRVIGAMTNAALPNLILFTTPTAVDQAGVENVTADGDNVPVDVYTISGIRIRSQVARSEAAAGLAPGLYIIGGQKVHIKP